MEAARLIKVPGPAKITVSLADERYGPSGHKDSNWEQLLKSGFSLPGADLRPILGNDNPEAAASKYNAFLESSLSRADYSIALLGMGADGHTAGIMPDSPAIYTPKLAVYYPNSDYQRITISGLGLAKLDEVMVYAIGRNKRESLNNLVLDLPAGRQPAQIIKQAAAWSVYNDLVGEKI